MPPDAPRMVVPSALPLKLICDVTRLWRNFGLPLGNVLRTPLPGTGWLGAPKLSLSPGAGNPKYATDKQPNKLLFAHPRKPREIRLFKDLITESQFAKLRTSECDMYTTNLHVCAGFSVHAFWQPLATAAHPYIEMYCKRYVDSFARSTDQLRWRNSVLLNWAMILTIHKKCTQNSTKKAVTINKCM